MPSRMSNLVDASVASVSTAGSHLDPVMCALAAEVSGFGPCEGSRSIACSNDVAELCYSGGRSLIIKRAHYAWAASSIRASRLAARLLRRRTGVVAPAHLELPDTIGGCAVEAYWRIPVPTLQEVWPQLLDRVRPRALRSWGQLLRRVHKVKLKGYGPLERSIAEASTLGAFLTVDLTERLAPAIAASWASACVCLDELIKFIPVLDDRVGGGPGVLVHGDLHMGNVLCVESGRTARCIGVLDLEHAIACPPEADLARAHVLHGPLFGHPLEESWFQLLLAGYGERLDALALSFFRVYHLLNLGYHATIVGYEAHAADVLQAAAAELVVLCSLERSAASSAA